MSSGKLTLADDSIGSAAIVRVSGAELVMLNDSLGSGAVVKTLANGWAVVAGITNSGTLFAAASGSLLAFFGTVTGGITEVGNGKAIVGGGEAVTFQSGGTGVLEILDNAAATRAYDGTISHFGQNIHQTIDLANVKSAANVSATYASANAANTSGTLTVRAAARWPP